MKKYFLHISLLLLSLTFTAMTCEDGYEYDSEYYSCNLTDVKVYSWDNSEEIPQKPVEGKIARKAYLLEIQLLSDAEIIPYNDYYANYKLEDEIVKINIYTEESLNDEFPAGADVTSCFRNYPVRLTRHQIEDPTEREATIWQMQSINQIFKALMVVPQQGIHRFRIVLTTQSGSVTECISDPIILY